MQEQPDDYSLPSSSMQQQPDNASVPPALQRIASMLRLSGLLTFWLQLAFGVIALVLLAVFAVSQGGGDPNAQGGSGGTGFGIFCALCGLVTLGIGIYVAFRYIRFSAQLRAANTAKRPSKAETLQLLKLGLITNLIGMFFTILGSGAIVGSLLTAALEEPQNRGTFNARWFGNSIDLLGVQANIITVLAHYIGITAAIWLYSRVNR
ncbi:MAG: DUF3611 family protein [Symploca sp. SIO3E6]|nr:DUF3611 family protein [Caldora sp. SIO3E6]